MRTTFLSSSSTKIFLAVALCGISFSTPAIQPMSAGDMEGVSAELGENLLTVLNVVGNPAAGLTDEPLTAKPYKESSSAEPLANAEIRSMEQSSVGQTGLIASPTYSTDQLRDAVSVSKQTVGVAKSFSTSSEISYLDKNFTHTMKQLQDGSVAVNRDLVIDLLKLENLRGDRTDRDRSAGSIYISDWHSLGETIIK